MLTLFVFACVLWCVFVLFILCALCYQFLWIVHFSLPLRCSLVFISLLGTASDYQFFVFLFVCLFVCLFKNKKIFRVRAVFPSSVPHESYLRSAYCAPNLISMVFYYHWGETSAQTSVFRHIHLLIRYTCIYY